MINFHCIIIQCYTSGSLDSAITHASALFLDREIHQLVVQCKCQMLYFLHWFDMMYARTMSTYVYCIAGFYCMDFIFAFG